MFELDPVDILEIWESHHGKLEPKWRSRFFNHPAIKYLRKHSREAVGNALYHDSSLKRALEVLDAPLTEEDIMGRDWDLNPHDSSFDIF